MTTTRTDAHNIYSNLYKKKRSPEHQKQVDEVIARSNDVFIRIDLIKKLDEEFFSGSKNPPQERELPPEREREQTQDESSQQSTKSDPKQIALVKDVKPIPANTGGGGLLGMLFGGNAQITKFAKESKSLDLGLFGRKPTISKAVERIFRGLGEEQIIATIQAMKFCEQVGWKVWNALTYNIVVNFGRFFNSFISLDSLFRDEISAEVFLGRSTKMQMYYMRHIGRKDAKDLILKKVTELVVQEEKLAQKITLINQGLLYSLTLEDQRPTLTDAICAFYIVMNKKMYTWKNVEDELRVVPIEDGKFNASAEISKQIDYAISKVNSDIIEKSNLLQDINEVRKNYFYFTQDGKISFDFLNPIIDDYIAHYYPENMQTPSLKSTFKTNPHRLLQLLSRDIQSIYLSVLEGYIKVDNNGVKDVILVQNGLFFAEIDKMNFILRSLDGFNRKFSSFQYTFTTYSKNIDEGTQDQVEVQLMKLLQDAAELFGKFAKKLSIIISNHEMVVETEKKDGITEKMVQTKEKVIEEIKLSQRFIPYYDSMFITQSRIEGYTIYKVIKEMTKLMFNYAVIFKDKTITQELLAHKKTESDLKKLLVEYKRLTGKDFHEKDKDKEKEKEKTNENTNGSTTVG
jgi:hypothetical protein